MPSHDKWKCSVLGCVSTSKRSPNTRFCWTHYQRYRKGRSLSAPIQLKRSPDAKCALPFCDRPQRKRDWCEFHYSQAMKGRPFTPYHNERGRPVGWGRCAIPECEARCRASRTICAAHAERARHYGLPPDRYVDLVRGGCQGCGSRVQLRVDHDHACCPPGNPRKCGACVRGVLCNNCNHALGNAGDSPAVLRSLAAYLEAYAARV